MKLTKIGWLKSISSSQSCCMTMILKNQPSFGHTRKGRLWKTTCLMWWSICFLNSASWISMTLKMTSRSTTSTSNCPRLSVTCIRLWRMRLYFRIFNLGSSTGHVPWSPKSGFKLSLFTIGSRISGILFQWVRRVYKWTIKKSFS